MIAALLLAGTCAWMPSYPGPGPAATCSIPDTDVECRCSECFYFDYGAPPTTPRATTLKVRRTDQDGTIHLMTLEATRFVDTDSGAAIVQPHSPYYCPAKHDDSMPMEGRKYLYEFAWYADDLTHSDWTSPQVEYRAAPYAWNHFQPPVVWAP